MTHRLIVFAGPRPSGALYVARQRLSLTRTIIIGDVNDLRGYSGEHPHILADQWDSHPYREVAPVLERLRDIESDQILTPDNPDELHRRLCLWMAPHQLTDVCCLVNWTPEPRIASTTPVDPVQSWWGPGGPSPDAALGERDWDQHH